MNRRIEHSRVIYRNQFSPNRLILIVTGLLLAVLPLSFIAAGKSVLPGDVATATYIQSNLPAALNPLIVVANLLGEAPFIIGISLAVATMLVLRGHRQLATIVAMACFAQAANVALKLTLESPRPTGSLIQVSEHAGGFGFPSGHTMSTTVLALVLFYVATTLMASGIRRRIVQSVLLMTPVLMGVARIETGAHWPSDVVGAWLWGALAAIAIIFLSQRVWNRQPSVTYQRARLGRNGIAIVDMSGD